MNINIQMNDCHFIVKPESRKIVCIFSRPELYNIVRKYLIDIAPFSMWRVRENPALSMPSYFKGIATCAPEDEWNEELGKLIAFNKMKKKFCSAFFRRINIFYNDMDQRMEQSIVTCDLMGEKWNKQITDTEKKIESYFK